MLNLKQIKHNIRLIKGAGEKLDTRVHETGVSILEHAREHGRWTDIQSLYEALPKSGRRKAFVKWVVDHSPLIFDDKLGKFAKSKASKREYDVDGANATPFWDYTKEVVQTLNVDNLLNIEQLIAQAYKRIQSAQEKGAPIEGDINAFRQRAEQFKNLSHAS